MVDTNDEWIRTRTGISERRILKGEDKATSDMVVPAVQELCKKRYQSGRDRLPDCRYCYPGYGFPSTANIACDKLGAKMPGALMWLQPVLVFILTDTGCSAD